MVDFSPVSLDKRVIVNHLSDPDTCETAENPVERRRRGRLKWSCLQQLLYELALLTHLFDFGRLFFFMWNFSFFFSIDFSYSPVLVRSPLLFSVIQPWFCLIDRG